MRVEAHAEGPKSISEAPAVRIRHRLQKAMTDHAGIVRSDRSLETAKAEIEGLLSEFDSSRTAPFSSYAVETRNMLVTAGHVVRGAMARRENVGLHYNRDLPQRSSSE